MGAFEVCTSSEEARARVEAGVNVVLVVAPGETDIGLGLGEPGVGGLGAGRLAVWIGDPADPTQLERAREMGAELFGEARS
ncbi:MAG: hypothetical protein ACRDYC_10105 [Acidimicrobiales bacterium]